MNWLRNILAAFAFSVPSFGRSKDEATAAPAVPEQPINRQLMPGGTLAPGLGKHYDRGMTIAGGPGSQKIGETFDALPQHVKDEMIAARKGKIIRIPNEIGAPGCDMDAASVRAKYKLTPEGVRPVSQDPEPKA